MKKLLLTLLVIDQIVVIICVVKAVVMRTLPWFAASAGSVTLLSLLASLYVWLEIISKKPKG